MAVEHDDLARHPDVPVDAVDLARVNRALAHDLRNIFSVINLCAVDLAQEMHGRQALGLVMEVLHATERGLSVATELLHTGGQSAPSPRPTDLRSHVLELQSFLGRMAGPGVDTEFVVGDAALHTTLDRTAVTQLLTNLVSNARDAIRGAGRIRVSVFADGDVAVLTVQDDGPGVPFELRERLFDEGFSTKDGAHWGLGLTIVRRVVERFDGAISMTAALPSGVAVSMRFPLVEPSRSGLGLVVAADDRSRRTLAGALARAGFEVLVAADALEACDLVLGRDIVDIALLDTASVADEGLWKLARLGEVARTAVVDRVVDGDDLADRLVAGCVVATLPAPGHAYTA
jgi:CheY-like chemotaxis protein